MISMAFLAFAAASSHASAQISPYEFVRTYVTELARLEAIRKDAEQELADAKGDSRQAAFECIHSNTVYDIEFDSAIRSFDATHLSGKLQAELRSTPQEVAQNYKMRQSIMRQITSICRAFAEGPKPGVDYRALAADMPRLRGMLDQVNQNEFPATMLVFATLISDRPDSQGHVSHLTISCAQKQALLSQMKDDFGPALEDKSPPNDVAQAQVIREKLIEYKCAEEPR